MNTFDTDSNYSYYSDSLLSNASSLSGLSCYENEFNELRHLVNPSKHPITYLDCNSTPKTHQEGYKINQEVYTLKDNLQKSLQLNETYKNDILNLEKKIELKFHNRITILLKSNNNLQEQLHNANNQVERLINSYKKDEGVIFKEKLNLEKKIHKLYSENSILEQKCSSLEEEKAEIVLENKKLKINLSELLSDVDIKNVSIQDLKKKISEQHVKIQEYFQINNTLTEKSSILTANLDDCKKFSEWYKKQLHLCQSNKQKYNEEILEYKNDINLLNGKIVNLNIQLSKSKKEIDEVQFQALKEKEKLFAKLEKISFNCDLSQNVPVIDEFNVNKSDDIFYESIIDDLKNEICRINTSIQKKDRDCQSLKEENSELISKCLLLEQSLQKTQYNMELLEQSKQEIVKELEYINENQTEKLYENLQLKKSISQLEVDLQASDYEKQCIESTINVIRRQFISFKESYDKLKNELSLKNQDILRLENENQELFMTKNWVICELEKTKEKDIIIENLKRDISGFEAKIMEQNQNLTDLRFQILNKQKLLSENDIIIVEKQKEIDNYDTIIKQYKQLLTDYESKINNSQNKLKDVEEDKIQLVESYDTIKAELKSKTLKLDKALKYNEQLQNEQKHTLSQVLAEKNRILKSYDSLDEEYRNKLEEKSILIEELKQKLKKLSDKIYLKTNTDDQKANLHYITKYMLDPGCNEIYNSKNKNFIANLDNIVDIVFDRLNIDEFENLIDIKLKYLNTKLHSEMKKCDAIKKQLEQTNNEKDEKIKKLEILLQVKTREIHDKQKKMNQNNHTLLRKVKEHMRGRKSAEKQLEHLEGLYNSISDKYNTLSLSIISEKCAVQSLEELCDRYKSKNEELANIISCFETEVNENKFCNKCLNVDNLIEKLLVSEELSKDLQEKLMNCKDSLDKLNKKILEKSIENNSLSEELHRAQTKYKDSLNSFKEKEDDYINQCNFICELNKKLEEKEFLCAKHEINIENLTLQLKQANEKIDFLNNEVQLLTFNIQQKTEILENLEHSKTMLEERFAAENVGNHDFILKLKNTLMFYQKEIQSFKNDKYFLQRLSNDLKVALKSQVEQNKNLRAQLEPLTRDSRKCNSLPTFAFNEISVTGKYDETYINQLLEENKAFGTQKPIKIEIQQCLNKLKNEIYSLQKQIMKQNCNDTSDKLELIL